MGKAQSGDIDFSGTFELSLLEEIGNQLQNIQSIIFNDMVDTYQQIEEIDPKLAMNLMHLGVISGSLISLFNSLYTFKTGVPNSKEQRPIGFNRIHDEKEDD